MAKQKETAAQQQGEALEQDDFTSLLQKEFKPKSERAKSEVESAVRTLAQQVLEGTALVSEDAVTTINALIAEIDSRLTEQVNEILHHEEFQQLEGAWRGLHYHVMNTETDEMLKIRVMNITKDELAKMFRRYPGASWDQSPLFKKIYEEEYGQLGGEPFGAIVGDYVFDHNARDVSILNGMAQIAAAAHAPFLAAAGPNLLQMDSWDELANPRDLGKLTSTPEYAAWNSLRESDDSRYIALTMPRFLARIPYGSKTDPVEEFNFEEDTEGADSGKYAWANSAYAMATNITNAFKQYGWCTRIRGVESGGAVEGLPTHTFPTDDGGVDMKCPTEIAITDRREAELAKNGLIPLSHWKNTDYAVFVGAQSLHKPAEFDDPDATANANLGARLPYLFATCRFAHYLKCMVRDKVGSFADQGQIQKYLQGWIMNYVDGDPANSSDSIKAKKPLAKAEVRVEENPENPGYYRSTFFLRPHYQLEGLTVSLRLVSKLPAEKGA